MATAAEAATAAAAAPVEGAAPATPEGDPGQADPESAAAGGADGGAAPAKAKPVSEVVRLAREKRALERKVAELTARPAPKDDAPTVTRESLLADLKKRYEEDPEALLEEVAGEDFVKLAARLAKREETTKAPASKIEKLEKELADLKAKYEGDTKAKTDADAKAIAQQHIATVQKALELTGEDGEPLYPTLVSLDPDVLEEPVAVTAYKAVERAHTKECREGGKPDGKIVKRWTEAEQEARFKAAFAGLEAHYGKLRTPKTPSTPRAEEPEPSPTISNNNSSGTVDPPARRANGTLTVQEALRLALKEHGLSH